MNVNKTTAEAQRYVEDVRRALDPLSESDRNELIDELQAHIYGLIEDDDSISITRTLGDPAKYARELMISVGHDSAQHISFFDKRPLRKHADMSMKKFLAICAAVIAATGIVSARVTATWESHQLINRILNGQIDISHATGMDKFVSVPDLGGMPYYAAKTSLTTQGLKTCEDYNVSGAEMISTQSPPAGMIINSVSQCVVLVFNATNSLP